MTRFAALALAFAIARGALAATSAPATLLVPRPEDVSIRIPLGLRCTFIAGRTATQPERLAMQLFNESLLTEAIAAAKYMPGCDSVDNGDHETQGLGKRVFYKDKNRVGSKYLLLNSNACDLYQATSNALKRLRECGTRNPTVAQACGTRVTGALLVAAGMDVDSGGRCIRLPDWPVSDFPAREDQTLANAGGVDYGKKLPPLSAAFRALVVEAKTSHGAASRFLTAPGLSLDERSMGVILFAHGHDLAPGTGWTQAEHDALDHLTHIAMDKEWGGRCLTLAPDMIWRCVDRARTSHNTFHDLMTLKTKDLVRIGNHQDKPQLTSVKGRTGAGWLACIQDGSCTCPTCDVPWAAGAL